MIIIGVNLSKVESGTKSMKKWDFQSESGTFFKIAKISGKIANKRLNLNLEVLKCGTWPSKSGKVLF